MATKGEKIVTILCGASVNPKADHAWPDGWRERRTALTDQFHGQLRHAMVVGVFLRDGAVYLLLHNPLDGNMTESLATNWRVERMP